MAPEHGKFQRSVYIGAKQARRWLSLKSRLGLPTDYDLVVYLLDLADKIDVDGNDDCEKIKPDEQCTGKSHNAGSPLHNKDMDSTESCLKKNKHQRHERKKKNQEIKENLTADQCRENSKFQGADKDQNDVYQNGMEKILTVKSDDQSNVSKKVGQEQEKKSDFTGLASSTCSDKNQENNSTGSCTARNDRKNRRRKCTEKQQVKRDVRKAPEKGIQNNVSSAESTNDETTWCTNPPKLAIKIKLCRDCNSRHLQDTCPLLCDPQQQHIIADSVTLDDWLEKHKENPEVSKALSNRDPMSRGYSDYRDPHESSQDLGGESDCTRLSEEMQSTDVLGPLYARDSLPDCLELKLSSKGEQHGMGVFVKTHLPMHACLGPLVGQSVQEMDVPDDYSMRHIWEIEIDNKTLYTSTTNPLMSNWIRYVRPADNEAEKNVVITQRDGKLFLVTKKRLPAGTELSWWTESVVRWNRKNKTEKQNCGGCNLNFTHPVYYRLHCSIFHDTNYSLTIRKYHCKVCGAAVLGKENIMKHATELHSGRGAYQCQYCKKFFLRLNYLEMHRTYGCSQNPQRSRPLCDFCGRKFCQPQKLKIHIKRMHSEMSEVLREFQCKLCLKLLGSRAALQRHMKEVHHKDVMGAATCDRCGKTFQNKSNLKIHMLTHSGVKPFKCREMDCKAAFTTKQCLQFHYKKVHGLNEDMMPKIERSVAYTFDAYSGGLLEDEDDDEDEERIELQESNDSFPFGTVEDRDLQPAPDAEMCTEPCRSETSASDQVQDKFNERGGFDDEESLRLSSQSLLDAGASVFKRTESASLLVEAALDAAERDIGGVLPSHILEKADRESATASHLLFSRPVAAELDSYIQDQMLPLQATSHSVQGPEQYLLSRVDGSIGAPSRYLQELPSFQPMYLHSDSRADSVSDEQQQQQEGEQDLVAQNLSLSQPPPLKEKSPFSKYEMMQESEFALVQATSSRVDRFEPAEEQGLDMSTRAFGSQMQSSSSQPHGLDDQECHGVDLSRTAAVCAYSSPYASAGYSQVDVPRVLSLDSMARSHHLTTTVSRIVHSPPPAVMHHHFVPENLDTRLQLPCPSAAPSPIASIPSYNASYSLGSSYNRSGYHIAGFY